MYKLAFLANLTQNLDCDVIQLVTREEKDVAN